MNSWLELESKAPEGWFSQYDIALLYPEVARISEFGVYLEIGVKLGRSLWVASQAAGPTVEIWGIDILDNPKIPNTNFIKGDSTEVKWDKPVDVLFIDGNHDYMYVRSDIERFAPFVKKGRVILFHDYDDSSPGVIQAVDEFAEKNNLLVETFDRKKTSIAKVVV